MTLQQLKYFVSVCDHGSLSQAAKVLYITQPALTSAINNLEKEYNLSLFERKHNSMILTKDGEFFYEKAKVILEHVDIFERDLVDLSEKKTTIRIGVPPMIGSFLFPKIYDQYMLEHLDAKFEIWEEGSLSIRNKILTNTLDLGFSILNDSEHEAYQKEVILETELLFCVSKSNPLSKKEYLDISDIKNEPIILMREGFFQSRLIKGMYNDIGQTPNIVLVSSQILVIRNFVKINAGGAFLIKELVDPEDKTIVGIPFKESLKLRIGLIWRKNVELHLGAIEFVNYLKNVT
ncbi:LysR family transcriptional regulator [Mariniplasma anaerobium]|uniref:LysR family transcriptional regulator n=1 Tax=Mariniplasma anaerobium TaxID=2735436 RepID=A0A7U9TI39_9MOLU|nr:LysR family transcriptional regulator [Mariniplasma anaerobium]BCR36171.1 LysR family transcriptional regulator [Mariniplasma anaerobium]